MYPRIRPNYPNAKEAVRAFLRDDTRLAELVNRRVFFKVPKDNQVFPMLLVQMVYQAPESPGSPVMVATVQIDVLGVDQKDIDTSLIANEVVSAIESIEGSEVTGDNARAVWASVGSALPAPDADSARSRWIVTADFAITATNTMEVAV